MIIGHLPAGYLAAVGVTRRFAARSLFIGIVLGAVLPDLDILWFFFVDGGQTHHHHFLPHRPIVWLLVLLFGLAIRKLFLIGLGMGGLLHMALDTLLGRIAWFWPLSDDYLTIVTVPATQSHWVLSFMVHWTFLLELALLGAGIVVFLRRRKLAGVTDES